MILIKPRKVCQVKEVSDVNKSIIKYCLYCHRIRIVRLLDAMNKGDQHELCIHIMLHHRTSIFV